LPGAPREGVRHSTLWYSLILSRFTALTAEAAEKFLETEKFSVLSEISFDVAWEGQGGSRTVPWRGQLAETQAETGSQCLESHDLTCF